MIPPAHVLVGREDLPIPEWMFAWGASLVLLVSFFLLSALWRTARLEDDKWRPLPEWLSRVVVNRVVEAVAGLLGVLLLGLTIYAGLEGTEAPDRNFSLTFVFVTVWLGLPFLSLLFGDVFRPLNPWRAIGRAAGGAFRAVARQEPAHLPYPEPLGRWPAAAGLVAFVWLEVVYGASEVSVALSPHTTAVAALLYSAYTLAAMALFGAEKWCERGETFAVVFNMFSRLAPLEVRDRRLGVRRPLAGATKWAEVPGSMGVVVASIGATGFDGAQEGALQEPNLDLFEWLIDAGTGLVAAQRLSDTLFLVVCVLAVGAIFLAGVQGMRTIRGSPAARRLRVAFAHSLIPIAFAYLVAHYFSLFVFQEQAQFTYLLSNPLDEPGVDIFGTASGGIDYGVLGVNAIWYVQVGALVVGHVIGLILAHDRAVAVFDDPKQATRSQYFMLAVMVAFTCTGLFLLSQANQ